MKRVITVQDISCVGKCSLTVALPIISAMGVETCVIPTAVLSTHTAFKDFTFCDLTSNIAPVCAHWKKEHFHFDAIYTGYLGSFEQLELMKKLFDDFAGNDTTIIVDPCMADNGKLYTGFTREFALAMAGLCARADVIVPNMSEACYMLGTDYIADGYDRDYVQNLLVSLASLGAKKVVLKGIQFDDESLGIALYDSASCKTEWYFHKRLPQSFHGTGDIFASVLTGALVRGLSLKDSCRLAADFVVQSITHTLSHADYNWYGVDFESAIPDLVARL